MARVRRLSHMNSDSIALFSTESPRREGDNENVRQKP